MINISIEDAKNILNKNGKDHTNEEVKKIMDFLKRLAEIEYSEYKNRKEKNHQQS